MSPRHLITADEADLLLTAALKAALFTSLSEAWTACREWGIRYPEFALSDGCFAYVMHQAITTFARRNLVDLVGEGVIDLDDDSGFLMVTLRPSKYVEKHKTLCLKFNKLDSNLHPRGNRTFQNESIFGQQFLFEEPSDRAPAITMAIIGWCASPDGVSQPDYAIACNMDGKLLWSLPLLPPPSIGTIPMPAVQPPQGGPVVRSANKQKDKGRKAE